MWWRRLAIVRAGLSGCGDAVNVLDYVLDLGRIAVKRRGMTDATETLVPKPWISGIAPYVPGKSAGADGRPLIKLSANENPLGTGEKARAAFAAAQGAADALSRYPDRSEEPTSELQSLMRSSYAVF